jgi:hypothetical protein
MFAQASFSPLSLLRMRTLARELFVPRRLLSGPLCLSPFRPTGFLSSANTGNCGGGHLATFPGSNRNDLLAFSFGPPRTLSRSDPRTASGGDCPSASAACPCECGNSLVELFKLRREPAAFLFQLLKR